MADKNKIKLIACDMDGTFIDDDRNIPALNIEMVKECNRLGIAFAIASGRTVGALEFIREKLEGLSYYIIAGNGAHIVSGDLKNELYKRTLTIEDCKAVIDISAKYSAHLIVWSGSHLYVNKLDEFTEEYGIISGNYKVEVFNSEKPEFLEPAPDGRSTVEKMFWMDTPERILMLKSIGRAERAETLGFYTSSDRTIEIIDRDVDKGHGLRVLCDSLCIDISETMAFGDESNDLPMLETAGVAVAMGNAAPEVKAVCDIVTDTAVNAGVWKTFNSIFGGN